MRKPSWKKAPPWARWIAQDSDGVWWWFQYKPEWDERGFYVCANSSDEVARASDRQTTFPKEGKIQERPC